MLITCSGVSYILITFQKITDNKQAKYLSHFDIILATLLNEKIFIFSCFKVYEL